MNMKLTCLTAFLFSMLLLPGCAALGSVDEPDYTVVKKDGNVEVRRYEPFLVAETVVDGSFDKAGDEGFRRLFKYIDGGNNGEQSIKMTAPVGMESADNNKPEKIEMTAPVGMEAREAGEKDEWVVSFVMPDKYTMETLPTPNDDRVTLREVPGSLSAVIRYSGRWTQKKYNDHLEKLRTWIVENEYIVAGKPNYARYDPPFKPAFLRRNEIIIPIEAKEAGGNVVE